MNTARADRAADALRPVRIERNVAPYAEGSCMISTGRTRILCTASVSEQVPEWRRGRGLGWITAEYAMLPRSTHTRTSRERGKVGGRTQEIQRLIGRALRATTDMSALGERMITIDCDVLVADGGTRTAAITGGAVALREAINWLMSRDRITTQPMHTLVAATSVGIIDGEPRLDLEYVEDVSADVDMNIVALDGGRLVEVQGTGENDSFTRAQLDRLIDLGMAGIDQLMRVQRDVLEMA